MFLLDWDYYYYDFLPVLIFSFFFVEITKKIGARGVMVIVVGNGHGDTSSNPGRD